VCEDVEWHALAINDRRPRLGRTFDVLLLLYMYNIIVSM
jgi:hypothetical protein